MSGQITVYLATAKPERPGNDVNGHKSHDEVMETSILKKGPILATSTFASLHAGRHAFGASKGSAPPARGGPDLNSHDRVFR